jgi:hypothetical protein
MKYSNKFKDMINTQQAAEFLALSEEQVFWAQVEFAVSIAQQQVPCEATRNSLYASEAYWTWVMIIWDATDAIVAEKIVRKGEEFHFLDKEKGTYSSFPAKKAYEFYATALHKPHWEHSIPAVAFREARALSTLK